MAPRDGTPRRALLAAAAGGLAALAGCGGGGGDGSPTPTPTPTPTPEMESSWADPPYRTSEDGELMMAVNVSNPTDSERSGTLRLYFERNNTSYEETAELTLAPGESRVVELTFAGINASDTDGLRINKELT